MYKRPDHSSLRWMILALCLALPASLSASGRNGGFAMGGIQSPKGVGFCAEFAHDTESFGAFSLTADLLDIISGVSSSPGVKLTYHYNLIGKTWNDGKFTLYAGPGLAAGYVRNLGNHFGFMGGLSGDAGLRVRCLHSILLSLEFQADFGLHCKKLPDLSLYRAGYMHSYYPHLRIQYAF